MRALRAFAIQVSLARIASVSAKNESDRQLLAISHRRVDEALFADFDCAFDSNPLPGAGGIPASITTARWSITLRDYSISP